MSLGATGIHNSDRLDTTRIQRRALSVLVSAQILSGAGLAAGVTVGALLAQDMLGSTSLAGLPSALFTGGSALAAVGVGRICQARGRRVGSGQEDEMVVFSCGESYCCGEAGEEAARASRPAPSVATVATMPARSGPPASPRSRPSSAAVITPPIRGGHVVVDAETLSNCRKVLCHRGS
ncbi:hypothetical protein [Nocardia sp. 852002-51244_SCH5132740]|uniref:hypothetical protein n=1 Tax=Nocardia TaxID=1817 RepID=UPI000A64BA1C